MDYLIFKNRTPHEIKPFVGGYNQFFKRVELHSLCIYARLCTLKDLRIRWLGRDEISPLTSIFYVVVDGIQWCQCRIEVPCFMVQRIPRASFLTFVFFCCRTIVICDHIVVKLDCIQSESLITFKISLDFSLWNENKISVLYSVLYL